MQYLVTETSFQFEILNLKKEEEKREEERREERRGKKSRGER
jgi:hypothetical protein